MPTVRNMQKYQKHKRQSEKVIVQIEYKITYETEAGRNEALWSLKKMPSEVFGSGRDVGGYTAKKKKVMVPK